VAMKKTKKSKKNHNCEGKHCVTCEVESWPKWKRDIHICGTRISLGDRIICQCTHPKQYAAIRQQQRDDARRYSYWPGG